MPAIRRQGPGDPRRDHGNPYGATIIAGGTGERQPSTDELHLARFRTRYFAEMAAKLPRREAPKYGRP